MKVKILVTGASGFLGSNFCVHGQRKGHRVVGTRYGASLSLGHCEGVRLDIQDQRACQRLCKEWKPDAVIHCARYAVGLGRCEREREMAYRVNVLGTRNMAQAACAAGARFVYISSDWIFDGRKKLKEKYEEQDAPCPLSYYGFTKWAGEQEVRTSCSDWLILRPANIYGLHMGLLGPDKYDDSYYLARTSWAHKVAIKLRRGEEILLPDTLFQTPTPADLLVEVTFLLLAQESTGVFHVANGECVSRHQFAKELASTLGFNTGLVVKGSLRQLEDSWEVPSGIGEIVPGNTCLDVCKVEQTLEMKMLGLSEGLRGMKSLFDRWEALGGHAE